MEDEHNSGQRSVARNGKNVLKVRDLMEFDRLVRTITFELNLNRETVH